MFKDEEIDKLHCPNCSKKVSGIDVCHTYGSNEEGWFGCMGCWSAFEYYCTGIEDDDNDDGCGWEYTWGLNPENPRAIKNILPVNKPEWAFLEKRYPL